MTRDVTVYASRFLDAISHPLLIVDRTLRVVWVNDFFLEAFQTTREETVGSFLPGLGMGQWADPGLRELVERALSGMRFLDHKMRFKESEDRVLRIGGSQIPASGQNQLVLLSIELEDGVAGGKL